MKNESQSISERIEAFARELALSLRRIKGRMVESDLPSVAHPADDHDESASDTKQDE
jgi:hypothetical protein